jgi:dienelactone hydrolase
VKTALVQASGHPIALKDLPFLAFNVSADQSAIEFRYNGAAWRCRLSPARCARVSDLDVARDDEAISPDGRSAIGFLGNDLGVRAMGAAAMIRLTSDGTENKPYAASPGDDGAVVNRLRGLKVVSPAVLWSPDSRYIFTYWLDQTGVGEIHWVQAIPDDGSLRSKLYTARYSIAGDKAVPMEEPAIIDVENRKVLPLHLPSFAAMGGWSVNSPSAWWAPDSQSIYYVVRDRFMKWVALHRVFLADGRDVELLKEQSSTREEGGMGTFRQLYVMANGDYLWWSERDGFARFYDYDGKTNTPRRALTAGNWVTKDLIRVDETARRVYFTGMGREAGRNPYQQYLYSVGLDGRDLRLLTPEDGDHAQSSQPTEADLEAASGQRRFSASGRFFIDSYSRPDQPPTFVVRSNDGKLLQVLEQADISTLKAGGFTPVEPFSALAADGKTKIYGNIFRPSGFDPNKRYPVIDSVYPGPFQIRSAQAFMPALFDSYDSPQALAELGFIVVTIDGRGVIGRGRAFLDHSYGHMELASDLDDHIAAIRQLAVRYPSLDLSRVGLTGMSAGGNYAVRALLLRPEFFKVAVSASGDHDRRLQESWWGEVYNGPIDPAVGPVSSGWTTGVNESLVANLRGKLLLMYGDMDPTVYPAQAIRLVDALERANKDFDLIVIPNGNHSSAVVSSYYIRRKWDYLVENLAYGAAPLGYSVAAPPSWVFQLNSASK